MGKWMGESSERYRRGQTCVWSSRQTRLNQGTQRETYLHTIGILQNDYSSTLVDGNKAKYHKRKIFRSYIESILEKCMHLVKLGKTN